MPSLVPVVVRPASLSLVLPTQSLQSSERGREGRREGEGGRKGEREGGRGGGKLLITYYGILSQFYMYITGN